jgi:hypothetical protein
LEAPSKLAVAHPRLTILSGEATHDVLIHGAEMPFPIKVCAICKEEFELKPDKPGFANRCPQCSAEESPAESSGPATKRGLSAEERKTAKEENEARRQAMRNLLYRKDS